MKFINNSSDLAKFLNIKIILKYQAYQAYQQIQEI